MEKYSVLAKYVKLQIVPVGSILSIVEFRVIQFCIILFCIVFLLVGSTEKTEKEILQDTHSRYYWCLIISCAQFLGIFVGGIVAGIIYSGYRDQGVFVFAAFLAVVWFFIAIALKKRIVFSNH